MKKYTPEPMLQIFVDGQHYSTHYPETADDRAHIINKNRDFYKNVTYSLTPQR